MVILAEVLPLWLPVDSIFLTTSSPSTTVPNTTCFPSSLQQQQNHHHHRENIADPAWTTAQQGPLPWGLVCADEELGPVGVGPSIGHGQGAGDGVIQGEVLVGELVAVDGLSTGSIVVGEVTALHTHTNIKSTHTCRPQHEHPGNQGGLSCHSRLTWHMNLGMMRWKLEPL